MKEHLNQRREYLLLRLVPYPRQLKLQPSDLSHLALMCGNQWLYKNHQIPLLQLPNHCNHFAYQILNMAYIPKLEVKLRHHHQVLKNQFEMLICWRWCQVLF